MIVPPFRDIYNQYSLRVYNTTLSIVQNKDDAEEITQDVFVEVNRSLENFQGQSAVGTWIYRIAVNRSLDFLRKKKRKKRWAIFGKDEEAVSIPDFHHPGVQLENKEKAAILFKAIDRLPENQKTAFILAMIEELPQKEIAEVMKISTEAVESLIQRAKSNLRDDLENFHPGRRNCRSITSKTYRHG